MYRSIEKCCRLSVGRAFVVHAGIGLIGFATSSPGFAQDAQAGARGAAQVLVEEVVVTATKRESSVQEVPLAVTAFGGAQLEALKFQDLQSLTMNMPNVALDSGGSMKGYANFMIRGLGVASTIPSLDPTVGVFVDQIYQGIQSGSIVDAFDLEAVEVLRGPQGVLFGRNVTGGAILLRTTRPTDHLTVNAHTAIESGLSGTGLRNVADVVVSGPLVEGRLNGKIAVLHSRDDGYFRNLYDGSRFGTEETTIVRPALMLRLSDDLEILVRAEHGESEGQGAASQNRALFSAGTLDFSQDDLAPYSNRWTSASAETQWDVAFGDGTVTDVIGWRKFRDLSAADVDSTPQPQNHARYFTDQEQFSNELRYAGTFGNVELTTGVYYFTQDLTYIQESLVGTTPRTGGGTGTFDAYGVFAAADWHFTDRWTLNTGLRYNYEEKRVDIATVQSGGGDFDSRALNADFQDSESWDNLSPRIGAQYKPSADTALYAYYARGFRSGGYNFRKTTAGSSPGPFDAEVQDSVELGIKHRFANGRGYVNAAVFHNIIDDMQRDVQVPDAATRVIAQQILNAGQMQVQGVEFEAQFAVTERFLASGFAGYTDGEYRQLRFDLTNDGIINDADYALELPRVSPWTYGAAATYSQPLQWAGSISTRLSYSHRDKAPFTDNNVGILDPRDIVDATLDWTSYEGSLSVGLYGKNLTNERYTVQNAPLPDTAIFGGDGPGGPRSLPTFAPLAKGRVFGVDLRYKF